MFGSISTSAWFVRRLGYRLRRADLGRTAASLSFTTLLGLVPLFTVAFGYVARFSIFDRWLDALESFLLRFLLPSSGATVRHYLVEFATKAAGVKGVGIAFVIITALLLVAQVEAEINTIWGGHDPRSLPRRLVLYVLAFTAVPVLVGGAIYLVTWLLDTSIAAVTIPSRTALLLSQGLAIGVATSVFTLLYKLVPARPVRWAHALIGGLLAALAFDVARSGFAFYITHVSTYQAVYGAMATLPLFLVWIDLSWLIVLVGAAVTATLGEAKANVIRRRRRR